jgi:hypothetical protein
MCVATLLARYTLCTHGGVPHSHHREFTHRVFVCHGATCLWQVEMGVPDEIMPVSGEEAIATSLKLAVVTPSHTDTPRHLPVRQPLCVRVWRSRQPSLYAIHPVSAYPRYLTLPYLTLPYLTLRGGELWACPHDMV